VIYNKWDIVLVPFPFTDVNTAKKRPALVLNKPEYQINEGHLILLMITSARHSNWKSDILISDPAQAGLPSPSVIRFKMFSIDEKLILKKSGVLSRKDCLLVEENLKAII